MTSTRYWIGLFYLISILMPSALDGQNLVRNGDFNNLSLCPDDHGQIERAVDWRNPSDGSTDVYNRCAGAGPCITCVPNFLFSGFQEPVSGDGYAGMFTTWLINGNPIDYREYLQTELTSALIAGRAYQFTMYVSILDGNETASSAPQVHFSTNAFTRNNTRGFYDLTPQIDFDTVVTDLENWVELSACYVAQGGERFMTIGNFRDNTETILQDLGPNEEVNPYYLLDDISLVSLDEKIDSLLPDTVKRCSFETYEAILPAGFDYLWSDGTTDNPKTITRSGTYIVTANSECIQDGMDTVVVIIDDGLDLNLPDSVFICEGGDILLQPGGDIDTWLWSDGSMADSFLITGPGLFWVEVSNRCGTFRDSIFAIRVLDPVSDLPSDTLFCEGDSLWLTADPSLNPTWEGSIRSDSFLITEAGTYVLEVSNFCDIVTDIIQVYTSSPPVINNIADDFFCVGDSLQVVPEVIADDWQWFDGSQDSIKWIQQEGWIWIEASTDCGLIRDSIYLTEMSEPMSQIQADTMLCEGETWSISIPSDYTVLWNDGSTTNDYVIEDAGRYIVEISSVCGTVVDTTDVTVMDLPDLEVTTDDIELCLGDSVVLIATSPNAVVQWDDNTSPGSRLLVDEEGAYAVSAENECGITDDEVFVDVIDCGCQVFIPNSFTPNGDNINDQLEVFADCELKDIQMRIFSRWGELLFASDADAIYWDGTFNGEIMLPGVYIYTVNYAVAGTDYVRSGSVTLLK